MLKILIATVLTLINYLVLSEAFRDRGFGEGIKWLLGLEERKKKTNTDLTVTVMIPAYNEADFIQETITSLQKQTYPIDRILVIDDSSTDGTGDIARASGAEVVRTSENRGTKAQAQDYGLLYVDTDLVINVDADTTLEKDAIEKLVPAFQDEEVAAVCGFVIPRKINSIWERARFIQYLFGMSFFKQGQDLWNGILVASGCFSGFRTEVLKSFGGFPDRSMAEDMDVTWEILKSGYKVQMVSNAYCYPISPHDYPTYRAQVERWNRGFLQNMRAHGVSLLRNRRVAFFAGWNAANGLLFPAYIGSLSFLLIRFGMLALLGIGAGTILPISYSLLKARRIGRTTRAAASFPAYILVLAVNSYLFFKAIWLEWIRKTSLDVWKKGHGMKSGERVSDE